MISLRSLHILRFLGSAILLPAAAHAQSVPPMEVQLSGGHTMGGNSGRVHVPWTAPGTPASVVLLVRNRSGVELNGIAATIDGPDSSEFAVTVPPASTVATGGSTSFTVRHLAQTQGNKSAALHIAGNASGVASQFYVILNVDRYAVDDTFIPELGFPADPQGCQCIAVEPEGRILAGGEGFIRAFHPDGTPDLSFFSPSAVLVKCIAVQRDGRIVLGGQFSDQLVTRGLIRIFPDGTLDTGFKPDVSNGVTCLVIQPDDSILAGGFFVSGAGDAYRYLVHLHPDGRLDTTYQPGLDNWTAALTPLPDGNVLAGGMFQNGSTPVNPFLSRFRPDGSSDPFPWQVPSNVAALAWRRDGSLLAALPNFGLTLLRPDGTLAPNNPIIPPGYTWDLAMQANGECVGIVNDRVFRIGVNGTVTGFPGPINETVVTLALQADGKVLIGGAFTQVGGLTHGALARLTNDPAITSLTRQGTAALRWMRGGTSPEVSDVSFEMNTPGDSAWTMLGFAARISGGWELTGLNLPATCQIRARGRAAGSLLQSTASFPTPLEAWRLQYFQTVNNTGDAADDADPDHDGLTNFTEYAFGLDPVDPAGSSLPEFKHNGTSFTATFAAPEGRDDVIYGAERSATMQPGTWTIVPDTGAGGSHTFSVPGTETRAFVRYSVKMR